MATIKSATGIRDTIHANVLAGTDGTDRTYAAFPVVRTLSGTLAGTGLPSNVTGIIVIGSPRISAPPDGTTLATQPQFRVLAARFTFPAAITADATNNIIFALNRYAQSGVTATALGLLTTTSAGTGNIGLAQSIDMSITAANALMDASGTLAVIVDARGTGGSAGNTVAGGVRVEVDVVPV